MRSFDLLADGTYQAQDGDFATLSLNEADTYTLTEQDGTATVFNGEGKIDYIEDTNGNRITTAYGDGQLTSLTDSFGNSLTFEYNGNGRITTVTDSDGRTTNYGYDESGELLTTVTDEAGTTSYTYDGFAVESITDPNGTTIEFTYDDRGRLTQQSVSGGETATEVTTYTYGEAGEVTVTDAQGNETELLLNENGQVARLTDANGRLINFGYDSQGNLTNILAPDNNSTAFTYDDRGNVTSQIDAAGNTTEFTYDPAYNQLTGFTDPLGNGINYSYDQAGNLETINYADGSSETFDYNENGDVTVSANRRGQEILYSYNEKGQLTSQINPDAKTPIEYSYDARGNLDAVTSDTGTINLDYDESDRLTKITYPEGRSLEYTYDAGDRRTSMTDQDGNQTNYAYDDAGRLGSLTDGNGDLIVSYQYDEVGRLAREDKGNGTYTEYSYDLAGQLLSVENYAPDDTLNSSSVYTYDNLGRQTSLTTLDGEWNYEYDALGQLTGADFASTNPDLPDQNLTYEYDAAGNRINTIENGESTGYQTNNLNQYTDVNGFESQYDDDGNLVSKTTDEGTFLYGYNSENQLISVSEPNGNLTTYEYDPFGNRIASVVDGERTEYVIDPFDFGNVVGEYNADGALTASYTHGIGLETITNKDASFFYDFNGTGSTVDLTDGKGGVANNYFYSPFGEDISETEAVANPFEFVGQYGVAEEANGLDFMRARFYDSDTGRFTSPDPIGLNGEDTNLYRYVGNSSNDYVDPEGTIAFLAPLVPIAGNALIGLGGYLIGSALSGKEPTLRGATGSAFTGAAFGGVGKGLSALQKITGSTTYPILPAVLGYGISALGGATIAGNPADALLSPIDLVTGKLLPKGALNDLLEGTAGELIKNSLDKLVKPPLSAGNPIPIPQNSTPTLTPEPTPDGQSENVDNPDSGQTNPDSGQTSADTPPNPAEPNANQGTTQGADNQVTPPADEVGNIPTEQTQVEPTPEQPQVEPTPEQPQVEPTPEQPQVEPTPEQPQVEPTPEQPQVEPTPEQPQVEPTPEQPQVEPTPEQPQVEPTPEQPQVEPTPEQPVDDGTTSERSTIFNPDGSIDDNDSDTTTDEVDTPSEDESTTEQPDNQDGADTDSPVTSTGDPVRDVIAGVVSDGGGTQSSENPNAFFLNSNETDSTDDVQVESLSASISKDLGEDNSNPDDSTSILDENDIISGTEDNDTLTYGAGNNLIDGKGGNDSIDAGAGDDRLTGGAGDDSLDGGNGDDFIYGGAGIDTLFGGEGADIYAFDSLGEIDTIVDFAPGDSVQVSGFEATSIEQFTFDADTGTLFFLETPLAVIENADEFDRDRDLEIVSSFNVTEGTI